MTITLTREEAQQVLDALEAEHSAIYGTSQTVKATELLRTRLAQPEPEPWAGVDFDVKTVPPQSNWQGLTDDEKEDVLKGSKNAYDAIERIEAKLKEKNT